MNVIEILFSNFLDDVCQKTYCHYITVMNNIRRVEKFKELLKKSFWKKDQKRKEWYLNILQNVGSITPY